MSTSRVSVSSVDSLAFLSARLDRRFLTGGVALLVLALVAGRVVRRVVVGLIVAVVWRRVGVVAEAEVVQHPLHHQPERRLVADLGGEVVEVGAGLRLDIVADQRDARLRHARRLLPGQPLAHDKTERGRQRHLVGRAGTDDRVHLDPRLGHPVEVQRDPGHVGPADRLDPRLFDGVDDVAGDPGVGQVGGEGAGVVVALAQGKAIGPAARFGDLLGGQRPVRLRHLGLVAVARRLVGGVRQVEVGLVSQRAQGRGEGDAEVLERVVGLRHQPPAPSSLRVPERYIAKIGS